MLVAVPVLAGVFVIPVIPALRVVMEITEVSLVSLVMEDASTGLPTGSYVPEPVIY